jgi:hypothetical protein
MKTDLNKIFEGLLTRYIASIERNLQIRYMEARDKEHVQTEIQDEIKFFSDILPSGLEKESLVDIFLTAYKRGKDINETFSRIRKEFGEVNDIKPFRKIENGKAIAIYLTEEERELKELALNQRKLMKFLVRVTAYKTIEKRLPTMFLEPKAGKNLTSVNQSVKWTGSKDNKNEFVQLVYSLHEAGLINNGKGEITKTVEAMAELFDLKLSQNWQSNHSASIHKAKSDYEPPVFNRIKKAYKEYTEGLIEEKKKRK